MHKIQDMLALNCVLHSVHACSAMMSSARYADRPACEVGRPNMCLKDTLKTGQVHHVLSVIEENDDVAGACSTHR